ncbi:hypothetical protein [Actinoallomurus iriomotensis]|uniref:Transposase n=1 Tax=Actinoallomurus iriomotensis TaxID=478107 RepID=A0A9W6VSG8_9ACTN|nr:hypothetical protein [Actinoallomurus iriomotensis]GLY78084.1 hypothetical protein Airi01_063510 [Actinoallomurus iriomotensis]
MFAYAEAEGVTLRLDLWLGAVRPGRMPDVTQVRTEGIEEQLRLHPTVKVEVDTGYRVGPRPPPPSQRPTEETRQEGCGAW